MPPQLTVCLTTKNSASCIVRAMTSVRHVADEVVIADSGSTDQTVALALEHGARVEHFPWRDDLSDARNNAISLATGNWILLLDSDEWLLESSTESLRQCLDAPDILGFYLSRRDQSDALRSDRFTIMLQLRLFRNHYGLQFRNRCHPQFHPPLETLAAAKSMVIADSLCTIGHDGYVPQNREDKLRRAARLLMLDLAQQPDDIYNLIEYGRTLYLLHDPRAAAVLQRASVMVLAHRADPIAPTPMAALLLECLLRQPALAASCGVEIPELLILTQRWFPTSAPLLWIHAHILFQAGNFAAAAVLLEHLIRMGKDHSYDRHTSFDPRILGDEARLNLGICLLQLQRIAEGRTLLEPLFNHPDLASCARSALGIQGLG